MQVGKWNIESRSGMHEDKHGEKSQQVIPSIQPLHTYVRTFIHVYVRTYTHYHHYKCSLAEVRNLTVVGRRQSSCCTKHEYEVALSQA